MSRLEVEGIVKTLGGGAEGSAILRGVDLVVRPGECLGLKGATGSGKSTLLRIIAGLMPADAGELRLDGARLTAPHIIVPPSRRRIGMVFQNLGLWPHMTVLGHLSFVLAAENLTRTEQALRLDEVINAFVLNGLGERYPAELSGGERQRVAIARALVKNAPILILDEATSSLDSESESLIQEALHELMQGKTVMVIAHRLSTIMEMDRIIVIESGRVVDTGTHTQLLQREGTYKKLWQIQAGGFLP